MFSNTRYCILLFLFLCLIVASCTKGYFVSELNVNLYIPQLVKEEVKVVHLSFHGSKGEFLLAKEVAVADIQEKKGLIKLKVPVLNVSGEQIIVTCASDANNELVYNNDLFNESSIRSVSVAANKHCFAPSANYRFSRHQIKVYPFGVRTSIDTLEVFDKFLHKGSIELNFSSMPSDIKSARVNYYGLGSSLNFYGVYNKSNGDQIQQIIVFEPSQDSYVFNELFLPSVGQKVAFNSTSGRDENSINDESPVTEAEYVDFLIEFLGADGNVITTYSLSEDDSLVSRRSKDVEDPSKCVLKSRETLSFTFKKFSLVNIGIVGWDDDVTDGDLSPM